MGYLNVTGLGQGTEVGQAGLEVGDSLFGGLHFKNEGGGRYTFRAYAENGDDKGLVTVTVLWLKANTTIGAKEEKTSPLAEVELYEQLEGRRRRTPTKPKFMEDKYTSPKTRTRTKKKEDPSSKNDEDETPKRRGRPKRKSKKEESDYDLDRENISDRRSGSNKNSQSEEVKCEDPVGKTSKKRKPERPEGETKKQIGFLKTYAKQRTGCSCFEEKGKSEEQPDTYETLAEATRAVYAILCQAKKKNNGEKPQQCDAFTIMRRKGRYRILVTNSSAACVKPKETNEKGAKGIQIRSVRPFKEPELSGGVTRDNMRCYAFNSCSVCSGVKVANTVVIADVDEIKKIDLDPLEDLKTGVFENKEIYEGNLSGFVKKVAKRGIGRRRSQRYLIVSKIQPNENPQTVQAGWTLHHSEMEALIYAKRRGWTIVRMYIDRDCCKVCGATLGEFAPEVFNRIFLIDWDNVCGEVEIPKYDEPESEREEEEDVKASKTKRRKIEIKQEQDDEENGDQEEQVDDEVERKTDMQYLEDYAHNPDDGEEQDEDLFQENEDGNEDFDVDYNEQDNDVYDG